MAITCTIEINCHACVISVDKVERRERFVRESLCVNREGSTSRDLWQRNDQRDIIIRKRTYPSRPRRPLLMHLRTVIETRAGSDRTRGRESGEGGETRACWHEFALAARGKLKNEIKNELKRTALRVGRAFFSANP